MSLYVCIYLFLSHCHCAFQTHTNKIFPGKWVREWGLWEGERLVQGLYSHGRAGDELSLVCLSRPLSSPCDRCTWCFQRKDFCKRRVSALRGLPAKGWDFRAASIALPVLHLLPWLKAVRSQQRGLYDNAPAVDADFRRPHTPRLSLWHP